MTTNFEFKISVDTRKVGNIGVVVIGDIGHHMSYDDREYEKFDSLHEHIERINNGELVVIFVLRALAAVVHGSVIHESIENVKHPILIAIGKIGHVDTTVSNGTCEAVGSRLITEVRKDALHVSAEPWKDVVDKDVIVRLKELGDVKVACTESMLKGAVVLRLNLEFE